MFEYKRFMRETKGSKSEKKAIIQGMFYKALSSYEASSHQDANAYLAQMKKLYHYYPPKHEVVSTLEGTSIVKYFNHKSSRGHSGVAVISTMPDGREFSCQYDCHYCPNEKGQPRSYLSTEMVNLRMMACEGDSVAQLVSRAISLRKNGHTVDQIELIMLGGTFHSYDKVFRENFIRDMYYAANIWEQVVVNEEHVYTKANTRPRPIKTLEEEMKINETASSRIIGYTIETRPDQLTTLESVRNLRKLGVTRVQLGVQTDDEAILKRINRQCRTTAVVKAIRLLKDNCLKVDIHLMPDLPGSDVKKDEAMLLRFMNDPGKRVDQWKIYPTQVFKDSEFFKWYQDGTYVPYAEKNPEVLLEMLIRVIGHFTKDMRINRIVRDFPLKSVDGGLKVTHMRDLIMKRMADRHLSCKCIRCREIKNETYDRDRVELMTYEFEASRGTEVFLSMEVDNRLLGFLRLRFPGQEARQIKELEGAALIRELHVYGKNMGHDKGVQFTQRQGYGSRLMEEAQRLSIERGYKKIAVVSGVGVREYYRKKHGFYDGEYYLLKSLETTDKSWSGWLKSSYNSLVG